MSRHAASTAPVSPRPSSSTRDTPPRAGIGRRTAAGIRSRLRWRTSRSVAAARSATARPRAAGTPRRRQLPIAWRLTPNRRAASAWLRPQVSVVRVKASTARRRSRLAMKASSPSSIHTSGEQAAGDSLEVLNRGIDHQPQDERPPGKRGRHLDPSQGLIELLK